MSPRSFPGGQVQGPHNSTHACLVPPLFWGKNPKCRLDCPREPGWVIFWVCDGVDFHFPTLSFFVLFHLSLVLSTMKVTSLSTRWVWPDSVQFNLCPCLSPSLCAIFIATMYFALIYNCLSLTIKVFLSKLNIWVKVGQDLRHYYLSPQEAFIRANSCDLVPVDGHFCPMEATKTFG